MSASKARVFMWRRYGRCRCGCRCRCQDSVTPERSAEHARSRHRWAPGSAHASRTGVPAGSHRERERERRQQHPKCNRNGKKVNNSARSACAWPRRTKAGAKATRRERRVACSTPQNGNHLVGGLKKLAPKPPQRAWPERARERAHN